MSLASTLAEFVHRSHWDRLPAEVQDEAMRVLINWIGCCYGGTSHVAVTTALPVVAGIGDSETCTVLGHARRLGPLDAALVNALSASALAFDDTHLPSITHPSAPSVAAVLAYAQTRTVTGRAFMHAIVIGNEVQCRLARSLVVPPARSHLGLYMTGHTGAAGVAAGVGRLMGLSVEALVSAMGIGACHAGGFRATYASMCSGLIPANAAKGGLFSAMLASQGFTCSGDWIEAKNGFLDVLGSPPDLAAVTEDLGSRYECLDVVAKPFPAGVFSHATIDACLRLVEAHHFSPDDIERVEIGLFVLGAELTGRPEPRSAYEAQVSVYHWAAAALYHGKAGLNEASDACVNDPAIVALRRRISTVVDASLKDDEGVVTVTLRNGQKHMSRVGPFLGSPGNPLTNEQLAAKFLDQAAPVVGAERAHHILERRWNLAESADVGKTLSML